MKKNILLSEEFLRPWPSEKDVEFVEDKVIEFINDVI